MRHPERRARSGHNELPSVEDEPLLEDPPEDPPMFGQPPWWSAPGVVVEPCCGAVVDGFSVVVPVVPLVPESWA